MKRRLMVVLIICFHHNLSLKVYSFGSNIPFDIYWDRIQRGSEFNDQMVLKDRKWMSKASFTGGTGALRREKNKFSCGVGLKVSERLGNSFTSVDMYIQLVLWSRKKRWACDQK